MGSFFGSSRGCYRVFLDEGEGFNGAYNKVNLELAINVEGSC